MDRLYMGVRGRSPEGRKNFKKFVEIGNVTLKNLITFQKLHELFARIWTKIQE